MKPENISEIISNSKESKSKGAQQLVSLKISVDCMSEIFAKI